MQRLDRVSSGGLSTSSKVSAPLCSALSIGGWKQGTCWRLTSFWLGPAKPPGACEGEKDSV